MISKNLRLVMLAIAAVGVAAAPRAKAGEEMIDQENTPAPRYNYTQPQERIYYAPPAVRVAVYPTFGYYAWPYSYYGYGYPRYYGHHRYYGHGYGRYHGGRGHYAGHYRR